MENIIYEKICTNYRQLLANCWSHLTPDSKYFCLQNANIGSYNDRDIYY